MKYQINKVPLLIMSLLLVLSSLSLRWGISVYPAYSVEILNNSNKPVVTFSQIFREGEWSEKNNKGRVESGERRAVFAMVEPTSASKDKKYQVEARDLDGKLIKSWKFPFQEMVLLVIDNNDVPKQWRQIQSEHENKQSRIYPFPEQW